MDLQNIRQIGTDFPGIKSLSYLSQNTFLDYEAIILSYSGIGSNWSSSNRKAYDKRKSDLEEFINYKNMPLIVLAPHPFRQQFNDGTWFTPDMPIPSGSFDVIKEIGEKIEVIKNTIFTSFFEKYKNLFSYNSVFTGYDGTPILVTPHTKKVLAYYNKNVVFLPSFKSFPTSQEFYDDLFNLAREIRSGKTLDKLPEWTYKYYVPNEKEIKNRLNDIRSEIDNLNNELTQKNNELERVRRFKSLFASSGNSLEKSIEDIFRSLGFEILEVDKNRDDLIVKYKNEIAVVEIKGVNSSAAEKHANQLEKWVSLYFENTEKRPKGILIVNSYKDKPLSERTEPAFPDQMLKYSISRDHCLITSLQLLGFFYKALDQDNKEQLIKGLFNTVGIYQGFENWQDFIEIEN